MTFDLWLLAFSAAGLWSRCPIGSPSKPGFRCLYRLRVKFGLKIVLVWGCCSDLMGEPSLKAGAVMRLQHAGCPALAKKGPIATRLGLQVFDYHGEMVSKSPGPSGGTMGSPEEC